jgi:hypothetical protein
MRSRALGMVLRAGALSLGLLAPAVAGAQQAAVPPPAGPDLVAALRAGGHILYFRHADTDHRQVDRLGMRFEDCAAQRNLTDRGRDHARALGDAIRSLGIPVGPVIVGHAYPYFTLVGGPYLNEGEADAVHPRETDFEILARLGLTQWRDLATLSARQ